MSAATPAKPPRRWPLIATTIAIGAVLTMIGLGVWQIQRAQQKDALIALYARNRDLPATAYPVAAGVDREAYLFRAASVNCISVVGWRSVAGRSSDDRPGSVHIADCRTGGAEGPGVAVVAGWSEGPQRPQWSGGPVTGRIAPAGAGMRLVSANGVGGYAAPAAPSTDDVPQNHRWYAAQWFFFAFAAAAIYFLASRSRYQAALAEWNPAGADPQVFT